MLEIWRRVCEWGHALFGDEFEAHVEVDDEMDTVVWTFVFERKRYVDLLLEQDKARVQVGGG